MKKPAFALTRLRRDDELLQLVEQTDHRTLARWAIDCAERVMPYFEKDTLATRGREMLYARCRTWIDTGVFTMKVIRGASLGAHAAARDVGEDSPARSAAHAAGQAVATAHVRTHAPGAAIYAQQAVHRDAEAADAEAAVAAERDVAARSLERVEAAVGALEGMDEELAWPELRFRWPGLFEPAGEIEA